MKPQRLQFRLSLVVPQLPLEFGILAAVHLELRGVSEVGGRELDIRDPVAQLDDFGARRIANLLVRRSLPLLPRRTLSIRDGIGHRDGTRVVSCQHQV